MKAVVFHAIGDIRLEDVPEPRLKDKTDAIIRITSSAICGTDLHFVRGTLSGMKKGRILGHEAVGIVEETGKGVRNLKAGDRVIVPSTVGCGYCAYCRAGYYAKCDNASPDGKQGATVFFGGPEDSGALDGLQAEYARIPFATVGLVKVPDHVSDDQAILLSDIFPTAYFGACLAEIRDGNTVCVLGCGPVGQFAIASAKLKGAGRVFAVDRVPSRLEMARDQGAEVINFDEEDPVDALQQLTGGIGVDRLIDAVGVDAEHAHGGKGAKKAAEHEQEFKQELKKIAPKRNPDGDNWRPGDAPSQALRWGVEMLAKAGTHAIIGVYTETSMTYPIGAAMGKNLTVKLGDCNHRRYIPKLLDYVAMGSFDPASILTQVEPMDNVIDAYKHFDKRECGWVKVELKPQAEADTAARSTRKSARRRDRNPAVGAAPSE